MKKFHKYSTKSFTLIELLVVLAIVGLLTSAILPSLNKSRLLARDEKRLAELQQIKKAVKAYYALNGFYPRTNPADPATEITSAWDRVQSWTDLEVSLKSAISTVKLPKDPLSKVGSLYNYNYAKVTSGNSYGTCVGHYIVFAYTAESSFRYKTQECGSGFTMPFAIVVDIGKY